MLTFTPAFSARLPQKQASTPPAFSGMRPQAKAQPRFGSAPEAANALFALASTGALGIAGWAIMDTLGSGSLTEKGRGKSLMKAIKNGNNRRAEKLLDRGMSPTSVLLSSSFVIGNDYGHPFLETLRQKNFELAQKMIDKYGVNLEQSNYKNLGSVSLGSTSMADEALHMGPEALHFLLKNGLNPNQRSQTQWSYGMSPAEVITLGFKYENDDTVEMLKLLLDNGAKDNVKALIQRMQNEMEFSSDPDLVRKFRKDPEGYGFVKQYLPEYTKPRAYALLQQYAAAQGK